MVPSTGSTSCGQRLPNVIGLFGRRPSRCAICYTNRGPNDDAVNNSNDYNKLYTRLIKRNGQARFSIDRQTPAVACGASTVRLVCLDAARSRPTHRSLVRELAS